MSKKNENKKHNVMDNTRDLMSRVSAFLPQLKESNKALLDDGNNNRRNEDTTTTSRRIDTCLVVDDGASDNSSTSSGSSSDDDDDDSSGGSSSSSSSSGNSSDNSHDCCSEINETSEEERKDDSSTSPKAQAAENQSDDSRMIQFEFAIGNMNENPIFSSLLSQNDNNDLARSGDVSSANDARPNVGDDGQQKRTLLGAPTPASDEEAPQPGETSGEVTDVIGDLFGRKRKRSPAAKKSTGPLITEIN